MIDLNPSIFETVMLVCFGSSWPFAILKTIRSKTVQGKSIVFIFLIFTGYCSGVISKLFGEYNSVIWLYILNGLMVFTEILLYFKYNGFDLNSLVRRFSLYRQMSGKWGKTYDLEKDVIRINL